MSLRSLLFLLALPVAGWAAPPTEADLARLDQDLTPVGAERAGSPDGTIPPWTGGLTQAPAGYQPGQHHPDPFADERPLFVIGPAEAEAHRARLSAGHLALLAAYPDSFRLPVYRTHRTAAYPERIYAETRRTARTAATVNGGNGVTGAVVGFPFPIPQTGEEVIWNHLLRYRGERARRFIAQAAPTRDGSYTLVQFEDEVLFNYNRAEVTEALLDNTILFLRQEVLSPPRLAGTILLVHETLDQLKEPRRAWTYNPGQRRVRRAPNVAYDAPGTAADNMRTSDQFDMFNGALDRYDWKLVGKRELIIPYNSYRLHASTLKYSDILTPRHINPQHTRYELHRVWVVEATLKAGSSHIYPRRTFYVDEDSWQIMLVDQYDQRGQLWRVSEGHSIQYYDATTFWTTLEVHIDLVAGRYLAIGLDNESRMYDFGVELAPADFTPASLRREGVR